MNLLNHRTIRPNCSRAIIYTILSIITIFVFVGQPKSIFKSNIAFPWLTNVNHVQPLKCLSDTKEPDWPYPDESNNRQKIINDDLTVVIVTARPEFKRLPATLAALTCHLDFRHINKVIFLVPPRDVHLLEPFLSNKESEYWPWRVSIISDDILLEHIHTQSYRLQMMFKLVLAQMIQTEYYLILDSDCLAVWPIHVEQLLYHNKALYQKEDKATHLKWWTESEGLLQIKLETCFSHNSSSSLPTMGVTPGILSRTIALKTLCRLQKLYGDDKFLNKMANWALWRLFTGRMWTEYTLYYLAARCTKSFDEHHFHHSTLSSSDSIPFINLCGFSIWSDTDWTINNQNRLTELINQGLKWRQKEMNEADGQAIIDKSVDTHGLFSVLQGRHGVDPNLYHKLVYPLYIKYLKQQNQTDKIIEILNLMSDKLITE